MAVQTSNGIVSKVEVYLSSEALDFKDKMLLIGAYCTGCLLAKAFAGWEPVVEPQDVYDTILIERERQDAIWGGPFKDDKNTQAQWVDLISAQIGKTDTKKRCKQVAAMCIAALDSIHRKELWQNRSKDLLGKPMDIVYDPTLDTANLCSEVGRVQQQVPVYTPIALALKRVQAEDRAVRLKATTHEEMLETKKSQIQKLFIEFANVPPAQNIPMYEVKAEQPLPELAVKVAKIKEDMAKIKTDAVYPFPGMVVNYYDEHPITLEELALGLEMSIQKLQELIGVDTYDKLMTAEVQNEKVSQQAKFLAKYWERFVGDNTSAIDQATTIARTSMVERMRYDAKDPYMDAMAWGVVHHGLTLAQSAKILKLTAEELLSCTQLVLTLKQPA